MENETPAEIRKRHIALREELRQKTAGYIVTALGLVAGLAWNDAITSLIAHFFPVSSSGLIIKFTYAVLVTVAVVVLSRVMLRVLLPTEEE